MERYVNIRAQDSALFVIDVQRALFTRPNPIYEPYKLIETINALISRAQLYGVQVVYIQHANDSFLKKNTSGWNLHPNLTPPISRDLLIQKEHGNAFVKTSLQNDMERREIKNLIITGLVTQGCVRATSLGGLELDYRVILVKGGHSNYNIDAPQVIETRENEMENAGVIILPPENIDFS
jgi:nicotinamidase-related amidase